MKHVFGLQQEIFEASEKEFLSWEQSNLTLSVLFVCGIVDMPLMTLVDLVALRHWNWRDFDLQMGQDSTKRHSATKTCQQEIQEFLKSVISYCWLITRQSHERDLSCLLKGLAQHEPTTRFLSLKQFSRLNHATHALSLDKKRVFVGLLVDILASDEVFPKSLTNHTELEKSFLGFGGLESIRASDERARISCVCSIVCL